MKIIQCYYFYKMVCYKFGSVVRHFLLVVFSLKVILVTANGECSVNICDGEVPSCGDGLVFVNSLSNETTRSSLYNVMRVCDGRNKCDSTQFEYWKRGVCNRASPDTVTIKHQCISESSHLRISKRQYGILTLKSSENYQIFAFQEVCSSAIRMRTTVPTNLSLKRFTMKYDAVKTCIALSVGLTQNGNWSDLPSNGKADVHLPANVEFTMRLRCGYCLVENSAVWLIVKVSPNISSDQHTVETPVPFIGGRPYTVQSVPLVKPVNCYGNREILTTRRPPSSTDYGRNTHSYHQTGSTDSSKLQPTSMAPSGESNDMLVTIACSLSSLVVLVIFVVVLVYFCKKLRKRKASDPNNDNGREVIYSNMNPEDNPDIRLTNSQLIKDENCDVNPVLSSGHNLNNKSSSEYHASCDSQIEHSLLGDGERMNNGHFVKEPFNNQGMPEAGSGSYDAAHLNPTGTRTTEPLPQQGVGNEGPIHNIYDSIVIADTKSSSNESRDGKTSGTLQYESIDNIDTYDRLEKKTIPTIVTEAIAEFHVQTRTESNPRQNADNDAIKHIIIKGDEYAVVEKL